MDKKSRSIEVLLAVLAVALIVIALLVYLQLDSYFDSHLGDCWKEFVLPVITNLVSTLAAIAFSVLLIHRFLPDRSEEQDARLAETIGQRVHTQLNAVIDAKIEAAKPVFAAEMRSMSTSCARELVILLTQSSGNQTSNLGPQLLNKESVDSSREESRIDQDDAGTAVTRRKSNKKPKV